MRKIFLIIIISCLALAGFLFRGELGSYFSKENNFVISDTASVNRIEIISDDSIILVRQNNSWFLNDKANASYIAVNNFLFAFQRIAITGVISNPDVYPDNIIQLSVFEGRKRHSFRFYVSDDISFLQKKGSDKRFSAVVSGFPGTKLPEVVSDDIDHWSDRTLLNLKSSEILEVSVLHPFNPDQDFRIVQSGGTASLYIGGSDIEVPEANIDKEKLNFYLSYFNNVFYDYTEKTGLQAVGEARWVLRIKDIGGAEYELKVFTYPMSSGDDLFKALVIYNNQPGFKVTRFMVLDLLLQERANFLRVE